MSCLLLRSGGKSKRYHQRGRSFCCTWCCGRSTYQGIHSSLFVTNLSFTCKHVCCISEPRNHNQFEFLVFSGGPLAICIGVIWALSKSEDVPPQEGVNTGFFMTQSVASSVQDGGKVYVYGTLGGWDVIVSKMDLIRNVELKYFRLTRWLERGTNRDSVMRDIMRYLEAGVLVPYAGKRYELADFKAAIQESERDARGGKVLLVS